MKTGIRISNNTGTVTNEYPSAGLQVTIIKDGKETIAYVDGQLDVQGNAPAADTSASGNAAAGSDAPVGPRDQFTRPWRPGDRQPTDMEQMMKPDWFRDLPDGRTGTDEQGTGGPSRTIAANMGGATPLLYPSGTQSQTLVTGVTAGITAYAFTVPSGGKAGAGRISVVPEQAGDASGIFALSTEKGATEGDSVLVRYVGNSPSIDFQVGQDKPGQGPTLPTDVVIYLNSKYQGDQVAARQLVQLEAHDRT